MRNSLREFFLFFFLSKQFMCYILFEMCCAVLVTGAAGALSFVCNESQANFPTGDNKVC